MRQADGTDTWRNTSHQGVPDGWRPSTGQLPVFQPTRAHSLNRGGSSPGQTDGTDTWRNTSHQGVPDGWRSSTAQLPVYQPAPIHSLNQGGDNLGQTAQPAGKTMRQSSARPRRPRFGVLAVLLALAGIGLILLVPSIKAGAKWPSEPESMARHDELTRVAVAELADTGHLLLVNREYGTPTGLDLSAIQPAWPDVAVEHQGVTLHGAALAAVVELFADARNAQAGRFYVASGYRDHDQQRQLYDEAPDKAYVQPAGHSEHQTGLAVDIFDLDLTGAEMDQAPQAQWLAQNAWRYGLILRYPPDKADQTGIAHEPWHFRYVGQPHAWYIHANSLSLEEYIEHIKTSGGYSASVNRQNYQVSYQIPQNDTVGVPANRRFEVSSDNTGGYIVTSVGVSR